MLGTCLSDSHNLSSLTRQNKSTTIWINGVIYKQLWTNHVRTVPGRYFILLNTRIFPVSPYGNFDDQARYIYVQTKATTPPSPSAWKGRGTGGRWRQWSKEQKQRFSPRIYMGRKEGDFRCCLSMKFRSARLLPHKKKCNVSWINGKQWLGFLFRMNGISFRRIILRR